MHVAARPPRMVSAGRLRAMAAAGAAASATAVFTAAVVPGSVDAVPGLPERASALALDHVLAAAAGVALLPVAWGLWRGKRRALRMVVGALVAWAALSVATGAPALETSAALAAAALLLGGRGAFERGGVAVPGTAPAAAVLGVAAVASVLDGRWWLRSGSPGALALDAVLVLGLAAAALLLRSLLRPAPCADGHSREECLRATAIVRAHAVDSLDPFALREDKSFHFAHGGLLAYRTLRETAVVAGDPIGPPGRAPAILASFERLATERGWEVVVTGASDRYLSDYRAAGYRAVRIGEEAIVDPSSFSLEGRAVRKVRQSVSRVRRRGWTIEVIEASELSAATAQELDRVDRAWCAAQPRLHGFAMTLGGLWMADAEEGGVYVIARDANAELRSFLRFLSYRDGLSLDVMRRSGGEPNGVNEAMVVAVLEHARERGLREVSLNFAGFAHVMAPQGRLRLRHRMMRWLLRRAHGRFQLERLVRFNDKFFPEWRPRYLVHCGGPALPLGAVRVLQAEAYLRPPRP